MPEKLALNLPNSGYEVVTKILHAYVLCGDGKIPLNDVASKSGLSSSMVSRNTKFLISLNILEGGRDKQLTPDGKKLGIAIGNNLVDDIRENWRNILLNCTHTKGAIDMVKVQNGISTNDFPGKLASNLGIVSSESNKTGINTVIGLFTKAELLEEVDGKYVVQDDKINPPRAQADLNGAENGTPQDQTTKRDKLTPSNPPQNKTNKNIPIHIDLQIHISPEASPDQIDKVFQSIAKHIYDKK